MDYKFGRSNSFAELNNNCSSHQFEINVLHVEKEMNASLLHTYTNAYVVRPSFNATSYEIAWTLVHTFAVWPKVRYRKTKNILRYQTQCRALMEFKQDLNPLSHLVTYGAPIDCNILVNLLPKSLKSFSDDRLHRPACMADRKWVRLPEWDDSLAELLLKSLSFGSITRFTLVGVQG